MTYLSECMSAECEDERAARRIYPATRADVDLAFNTPLEAPQGLLWSTLRAIVIAIDIPFSLLADTLFLPLELSKPASLTDEPSA
jgi:uncharacterized protein YceK